MRKIKKIALLSIVSVCCLAMSAQENNIPVKEGLQSKSEPVFNHKSDFGLGVGLDYGGLVGLQVGYSPLKYLVLFGSAGYHMIKFGWQIGAKGLLIGKTSDKVFRPYLKLMYGSNSVIVVEGASEYDNTYLGFTAGVGLELRFGKAKHHGLNADLNFPFRTQEFWDDYDEIKNDPRIAIKQDVIPVAFSIGYHYEF